MPTAGVETTTPPYLSEVFSNALGEGGAVLQAGVKRLETEGGTTVLSIENIRLAKDLQGGVLHRLGHIGVKRHWHLR